MIVRDSMSECIARLVSWSWPVLAMFTLSMLYLALAGCATWQAPARFDDSTLRVRAETNELHGVKLSAAVLSSDDSQKIFGAKVNQTGVQPVWIEVANTTNQMLWLLRAGTDPDLFSPLEVAWSFHTAFARDTNTRLDDHFDSLSFQNPIAPGETRSGIIFTNPHHKTRILSIDLLGQGEIFPFTLFPRVPDDITDDSAIMAKVNQLLEAAVVDYQEADRFRARLKQLPCCATGIDSSDSGDPLNVVLVGAFSDIATALVRRGFRMDVLEFDKVQRLFGRPPDIVARKAGQGGVPANWLRMWVAPLRYQGQPVFLVQAGRRLGWRLLEVEAHDLVLNPNVDEVRNLLIYDLLYSSGLEKLAFTSGVGATPQGKPRDSLGGASYHTDGLRAVLFLVSRPLSLSDLKILDWYPYLDLVEASAVTEGESGGH